MFLRTVNIESVVKARAIQTAIITAITTFLWVASLAIGISSILEKDYVVILFYTLAAATGAYFGVLYNGRKKSIKNNSNGKENIV
jgi:hypothetical protein